MVSNKTPLVFTVQINEMGKFNISRIGNMVPVSKIIDLLHFKTNRIPLFTTRLVLSPIRQPMTFFRNISPRINLIQRQQPSLKQTGNCS